MQLPAIITLFTEAPIPATTSQLHKSRSRKNKNDACCKAGHAYIDIFIYTIQGHKKWDVMAMDRIKALTLDICPFLLVGRLSTCQDPQWSCCVYNIVEWREAQRCY